MSPSDAHDGPSDARGSDIPPAKADASPNARSGQADDLQPTRSYRLESSVLADASGELEWALDAASLTEGEPESADSEVCDPVDVLVTDFMERLRAGEQPTIEQYVSRHPQWGDRIRSVFAAVVSVESSKGAAPRSSDGALGWTGTTPQRLGDFRIVREIGRGGMGIVYEAEQESLGRRVALKILPPTAWTDLESLRKFQAEAKAIARLHHTNIVPIHGAGQCDGVHFLVMQLIPGFGLDHFVGSEGQPPRAARPLTPRTVASIGVQAADALAHAHELGVLHRDIKPANILSDSEHHVWVADFGLAKRLDHQATATRGIEGSLRYMAPERFRGEADVRSDVYALGLTLDEILRGAPAFAARDVNQLIRDICQGSPTPLREARPDTPRDLETVLLKATAREPQRRYASSAELRDDLQRFLDGAPVRARRASWIRRAWMWSRRNPVASIAAVAAMLALITATAASSWGWWATAKSHRVTAAALKRERAERERFDRTFALAVETLDEVAAEYMGAAWLPAVNSLGDEDLGALAEIEDAMVGSPAPPSPQGAAMLQRLLPLYDQLAAEAPDRADILVRSVRASETLAGMLLQLGSLDRADEAIERGFELLNRMESTEAASAELRQLLEGRLYNQLGALRQMQRKPQASTAAFERAIESLRSAEMAEARLELARAYVSLAAASRRGLMLRPRLVDRNEKTDARVDEAIAILEQLSEDARLGKPARLWMARCHRLKSASRRGTWALRRNSQREAVRILRALSDEAPEMAEAQLELAEALGDGGFAFANFQENNLLDTLQANWEEAAQLAAALVDSSPQTPAYAWTAAKIEHKLSRLYRFRRQRPAARRHADRAVELQRELVLRFPENVEYFAAYLQMLRASAEMSWEVARKRELAELLEEANELLRRNESTSRALAWTKMGEALSRALAMLHRGSRP